MTPEQIQLVEETMADLAPSIDAVSADFYRSLLSTEPTLRDLFPPDLEAQQAKFTAGLVEIIVAGSARVGLGRTPGIIGGSAGVIERAFSATERCDYGT